MIFKFRSDIKLKRGDKGKSVKELQENLNSIIDAGLVVDGYFGYKTENRVRDFQSKYGLMNDGIYGKESHNKMKSIINNTYWR